MIPYTLLWGLVVVGVTALSFTRDFSTVGRVALAWVVPFAFTKITPGRARLALPMAMAAVVAALCLGFSSYDGWTVVLSVCVFMCSPDPALRLVLASSGLMVVAGYTVVNRAAYSLCCAAYSFILILWLVARQTDHLGRTGGPSFGPLGLRRRLGFQLILTVATGVGAAICLPPLQNWIIDIQILANVRSSGFSAVTDLRAISSIKTSRRLVLRLFGSAPRLLRGQAYSKYREGRWYASRPAPFVAVHGAKATAPTREGGERIESELANNVILFAPLDTATVYAPGCDVERNRVGLYRATSGSFDNYTFWGGAKHEQGPRGGCPEEYLELPGGFSEGIRGLAASWTRSATSDRDKARAMSDRLGADYQYTLEPGDEGTRDPIERFLLRSKKGHCEYFASAMALLLRSVGVGTRYVAGYSVSERNPFGGYFVARDADAHAWVEVWHEGTGWVSYDPTPPAWCEDAHSPGLTWLLGLWDFVSHRGGDACEHVGRWLKESAARALIPLARGRTGWLFPFFLGAVCVGVFWLGRWILRRLKTFVRSLAQREGRGANRDQRLATLALARLETLILPLGIYRPPSVTPHEFLERIRRLGLPPAVIEACRDLIDLFCRTLYRGDPWDAQQASELLESLRANLARIRTKGTAT